MTDKPPPRGSLELLNFTQSPAIVAPKRSQSESLIARLSVAFCEVINTRNYSDPIFAHVSPTVVFQHDAGNQSIYESTKEGLLEQWMAVVGRHPNYITRILDTSVTVCERTGRGRVWVVRSGSGLGDGLKREAVVEMMWERKQGKWWLVKLRSLRGFPNYESDMLFGDVDDLASTSGSGSGDSPFDVT